MRGSAGVRRAAGIAGLLLFIASGVLAQATRPPAGPSSRLDPPGSHLTVYLMTMGPGRRVWERFGHNAIWIHDPDSGTDQAYNYGLFDFRQQNFLLRFIRGQMWYWMEGFPAERYIQTYVRDNRSVWIQELNLPASARLELDQFLRWNERPENRFYHYDYYLDNCSTRVRDAIDRVIGGRIKAATERLPTGTTYRFHTLRLTANDLLVYTGLLLALGQGTDRPISAWEEMFLPMEVREHIRRVTLPGPDGVAVPLVKSERTLFESTAASPPDTPPNWWPGYLLVGLMIGGAALGFSRGVGRVPGSGWALGALVSVWALLGGLGGVVLAGMWGFTDHVMAYRNENLFQANPVSLLLVPVLPMARWRAGWIRPAAVVAGALAALSVLGLVLKLVPGFHQLNGEVIALALPAHAGIALALRHLASRAQQRLS
jgi:Domain of unknown function (DUF4105)